VADARRELPQLGLAPLGRTSEERRGEATLPRSRRPGADVDSEIPSQTRSYLRVGRPLARGEGLPFGGGG
jgi:hypothetical protein